MAHRVSAESNDLGQRAAARGHIHCRGRFGRRAVSTVELCTPVLKLLYRGRRKIGALDRLDEGAGEGAGLSVAKFGENVCALARAANEGCLPFGLTVAAASARAAQASAASALWPSRLRVSSAVSMQA